MQEPLYRIWTLFVTMFICCRDGTPGILLIFLVLVFIRSKIPTKTEIALFTQITHELFSSFLLLLQRFDHCTHRLLTGVHLIRMTYKQFRTESFIFFFVPLLQISRLVRILLLLLIWFKGFSLELTFRLL